MRSAITAHIPVTADTIFFGGGPVATDSVEVINTIRSTDSKKIFEVSWHGQPAIAKWWATSDLQSFINEKVTYEKLHEKRTGGYPFFASPCAAGVICCSSKCPDGYILVITKVKGTRLERRWAKLSSKNQEFVYDQVQSAINVLRTIGIAWADPGTHNILFDEDDQNPSVSVVDFERIELCEDEEVPIQPEMMYIFGQDAVEWRDPSRYSSG